jgi:hypothetical protein
LGNGAFLRPAFYAASSQGGAVMGKFIKGKALTKRIEKFLDTEIHKYESTGLTIEQIADFCHCDKASIFNRPAIHKRIQTWQRKHPHRQARLKQQRVNRVVLAIEKATADQTPLSISQLLKRHQLADSNRLNNEQIREAWAAYKEAMGMSKPPRRITWHKGLPKRAQVVKTTISHLKRERLTVARVCRKAGINATEYNKRAVGELLSLCPQIKALEVDEGGCVYRLDSSVGRVA